MSFAVEPKGKKTLNPKQIGSSITLSRGSKKMPLRHERKKEEAPIRVGVSRLRLALLFEKRLGKKEKFLHSLEKTVIPTP